MNVGIIQSHQMFRSVNKFCFAYGNQDEDSTKIGVRSGAHMSLKIALHPKMLKIS